MKIILAIDDSIYSRNVAESVVHGHWAAGTQFKVLHVIEPLPAMAYEPDELATIQKEASERRMKHAEEFCRTICHKLQAKIPGADVHHEIRFGQAKSEILDAALEWQADKVLLGAHSRDVCPRTLTGSVSRAVATHATCSVEIIRPRQDLAPTS